MHARPRCDSGCVRHYCLRPNSILACICMCARAHTPKHVPARRYAHLHLHMLAQIPPPCLHPKHHHTTLPRTSTGKSTLLDILAARKTVGKLKGSVTVNGALRGASFVRHISYVPQEDNFQPAMTVAETCELHAALTLPRCTPAAQAAGRIDEVLAAMGMLHTRDTLVSGCRV